MDIKTFIVIITLVIWVLTPVDSTNIIKSLNNKAWLVLNSESGIYEGDYFNIFTFDYPYVSVYINDVKMKKWREPDSDLQAKVKLTMEAFNFQEVFLSQYKFPRLKSGEYAFRVSVCQKKSANGSTMPIALIKTTMKCEKIPLIFFSGETCVCQIDSDNAKFIPRPDWLGEMIDAGLNMTSITSQ